MPQATTDRRTSAWRHSPYRENMYAVTSPSSASASLPKAVGQREQHLGPAGSAGNDEEREAHLVLGALAPRHLARRGSAPGTHGLIGRAVVPSAGDRERAVLHNRHGLDGV